MKEVLGDSKKRLGTIRRAFGIEDYSIAEANAREIASELRIQLAVMQQKFSNIADLESQVAESQRLIILINSDIAKSQEQRKDFEDKEKIQNAALKELQAKNTEKTRLESKRENIKEKIDSAKSRIKNIEQEFVEYENELKKNNTRLEKLVETKKPSSTKSISEITLEIKTYQELNNDLIKLQSEKENLSKDMSRLKKTLGDKINSDSKSMENTLRDLENEKKSLERFYEELDKNLANVNEQKIQKQTLINSLQKEIAEFTQLGNACPTCKQEITAKHHHDLVDTKKNLVDTISRELKSITDSFFDSKSKSSELQSKIESYNDEILQIQKILPGIEEHAEKSLHLSQIEAGIANLAKNFQDLPEFGGKNPIDYLTELKDKLVEYDNVNEQINQIIDAKNKVEKFIVKSQVEVENLEKEITNQEQELKQIQLQLKSFANLDKLVRDKDFELDSIRKEINRVSSVLSASSEKLANEQNKIEQNQKNITESKKWEAKFNRFSQYKEWPKLKSRYCCQFCKILMRHIVDGIPFWLRTLQRNQGSMKISHRL
jgi:exonuclease SbcC